MNIDPRSGLTEKEVALLRGELLEARRELLERVGDPADLAVEGEPRGDAADQAELSIQQDRLAERLEDRRRHLRDIEDALARIEEGSYGLDEATGEPIGLERLLIEPWARYTVAAQEQREMPPSR
jgi:DnaK suppressor protein